MPHKSSITCIIGAALLVVQLALEMMVSEPFKMWWFTPKTTVFMASISEGADNITIYAPAERCALNSAKVLNFPVDSITKSGETAFQFMFFISFS